MTTMVMMRMMMNQDEFLEITFPPRRVALDFVLTLNGRPSGLCQANGDGSINAAVRL